jgi:hypothetical protein
MPDVHLALLPKSPKLTVSATFSNECFLMTFNQPIPLKLRAAMQLTTVTQKCIKSAKDAPGKHCQPITKEAK